jgi:hypothetical protein
VTFKAFSHVTQAARGRRPARGDQNGADQNTADQAHADQNTADQAHADRDGADQGRADLAGTDRARADRARTDRARADRARTDRGRRGRWRSAVRWETGLAVALVAVIIFGNAETPEFLHPTTFFYSRSWRCRSP